MCFFFFQAEDGIRDLVRSRGLGDVYKRQALVLLGGPFAQLVLAVTDLPVEVVAGAEFLLRRLGFIVGLLLTSNVLLGYLRAHNRFALIAVATALSQGALCLSLIHI